MTVCGMTSFLNFTAPQVMLIIFKARIAQAKIKISLSPMMNGNIFTALAAKKQTSETLSSFSPKALCEFVRLATVPSIMSDAPQ